MRFRHRTFLLVGFGLHFSVRDGESTDGMIPLTKLSLKWFSTGSFGSRFPRPWWHLSWCKVELLWGWDGVNTWCFMLSQEPPIVLSFIPPYSLNVSVSGALHLVLLNYSWRRNLDVTIGRIFRYRVRILLRPLGSTHGCCNSAREELLYDVVDLRKQEPLLIEQLCVCLKDSCWNGYVTIRSVSCVFPCHERLHAPVVAFCSWSFWIASTFKAVSEIVQLLSVLNNPAQAEQHAHAQQVSAVRRWGDLERTRLITYETLMLLLYRPHRARHWGRTVLSVVIGITKGFKKRYTLVALAAKAVVYCPCNEWARCLLAACVPSI